MSCGRILAFLQWEGKDQVPRAAHFTECVVDCFQSDAGSSDRAAVCTRLENNRLIITDNVTENAHRLYMKHPSFCPVKHLDETLVSRLSEVTLSRGVDTGVAVILESSDGKILLTKRAAHLRAFPNVWVPPGGHLELDETLTQAGLRELHEETGLHVQENECHEGLLHPLALWESVYPPKVSLGPPARHHIVLYLLAKLKAPHTASAMSSRLKFDPNEVAAAVWIDRKMATAIVQQCEELEQDAEVDPSLPSTIRYMIMQAHVLNEKQEQVEASISLTPFFQRSGETEDCERVSTGTKYALQQYLQRTT
ncbi:hypothetical protein BaRGS_00024253 [Batillaria attramentaria]|uniref:m7GpppN-mRNA hydrolase NUDT17 n=1 Tax=Batillaria attramentaria TaxID=370345 RepID=A0ABD0KBR8_9CAEN